MAKILSPREYDIRSLAYYLAEGGVYIDIITVLTKMRNEAKFRGLPTPARALNEACFIFDRMRLKKLTLDEEKQYIGDINIDLAQVLVALMATAQEDHGFCIAHERHEIIGDKNPYLPLFDDLFEQYMDKVRGEVDAIADEHIISDLDAKIEELHAELEAKDNLLASANAKIDELQQLVDTLKVRNESKYDKTLNRKNILEYVKNQRVYTNVNQIFEMLMYLSRVATDEEYNEIVNLRQAMIDACVPTVHNHNDIKSSNVFPGMVNNPTFPIGADPEEIAKKALELYIKSQNDGQEG